MLMAKEKIETQGDGTNNQNNLAHWSSGELDNHAQRMRLKQIHKVGQGNKITEMGERKTKVKGTELPFLIRTQEVIPRLWLSPAHQEKKVNHNDQS